MQKIKRRLQETKGKTMWLKTRNIDCGCYFCVKADCTQKKQEYGKGTVMAFNTKFMTKF